MSPEGSGARRPTASTDVLGPVGAGYGPVGIVRELARDLLRDKRMTIDEAISVNSALRTRDWSAVRVCVEKALERRGETPAEGAAVAAAPAPVQAPVQAPAPAPRAAPAAGGNEMSEALLHLAKNLCDAVAKLSGEEARFASVRALLDSRLTVERVAEVDARMGALVGQQLAMQQSLQDARLSLKEMLTLLLERLASVGNSTSRFRERVSAYQELLVGQPDVEVVSRVAGGLLADTRAVAEQIQASQDELVAARRKVETYEKRVRILEQELAQTARMVQNDPLTQALNRRGLVETFRVETARAQRFGVPLVLAMVDLDDFKSINDSFGHAAGDRALVHFVTAARACLRPTDAIARTGGEEFVVVLPATAIENAIEALQRMQRELARSPFVHEGRPLRVTFSGGAAQWRPGETLEDVLHRADAAMYEAKRSGKNRVNRSD